MADLQSLLTMLKTQKTDLKSSLVRYLSMDTFNFPILI
jgi:hypothetical protein